MTGARAHDMDDDDEEATRLVLQPTSWNGLSFDYDEELLRTLAELDPSERQPRAVAHAQRAAASSVMLPPTAPVPLGPTGVPVDHLSFARSGTAPAAVVARSPRRWKAALVVAIAITALGVGSPRIAKRALGHATLTEAPPDAAADPFAGVLPDRLALGAASEVDAPSSLTRAPKKKKKKPKVEPIEVSAIFDHAIGPTEPDADPSMLERGLKP